MESDSTRVLGVARAAASVADAVALAAARAPQPALKLPPATLAAAGRAAADAAEAAVLAAYAGADPARAARRRGGLRAGAFPPIARAATVVRFARPGARRSPTEPPLLTLCVFCTRLITFGDKVMLGLHTAGGVYLWSHVQLF